jgi:hypothetical protein
MTSVLNRLSERLGDLLDMLGMTVQLAPTRLAAGSRSEPEFRRDHDAVADRRQGLADQFLVGERAVNFGGVEERNPALDRGADKGDHLLLVLGRTIGKAHAHAAEPDRRNLEAALSQLAFLHCSFSLSSRCQAPASRGAILIVAERARAPIIGARYGLSRYFAR